MPRLFPVSSDQTIYHSRYVAQRNQTQTTKRLEAISGDEPLPLAYARDQIRLVAQSPYRLFLHWNLARDPRFALQRLATNASAYRLAVRLVEVGANDETLYEASETRTQWFDVRADASYRAEVGFAAANLPFIRLITSNTVRTPRAGVAHEIAQNREFRVEPSEFVQVLDESGYVSDAVEVAIEAADAETDGAVTTLIASRVFNRPDRDLAFTDAGLYELRALLTALAFGANLSALRTQLSPALAQEMLQTGMFADDATFDVRRLFEMLSEILAFDFAEAERVATEYQRGEVTARFIIGGSDVHLPVPPAHLWLPSMNRNVATRLSTLR